MTAAIAVSPYAPRKMSARTRVHPLGVASGRYRISVPSVTDFMWTRTADTRPIRTDSWPSPSATTRPARRRRWASGLRRSSGRPGTVRSGKAGRKKIARSVAAATIGARITRTVKTSIDVRGRRRRLLRITEGRYIRRGAAYLGHRRSRGHARRRRDRAATPGPRGRVRPRAGLGEVPQPEGRRDLDERRGGRAP